MASSAANELISTNKTSDSRLQVQLHPLVILTISDYITRHFLRQQNGPIVGAILGSQHGRDITMEHAFECKLEAGRNGDVVVDASWFHERLQQFKDVHKAAALDFVGWFTLGSPTGPQPHQLPIHQQLLQIYNESALLLLFHPSSVSDSGSSKGGKLPLAIYESVYETITSPDGDKQMSGGGGGGGADPQAPQHTLRFQELPYTIETGEAEMISVDFVARGGANAAVSQDSQPQAAEKPPTPTKDPKGKGKASQQKTPGKKETSGELILTPEDDDHIASLTAKANAIRMLQQRVALMRSYLQALPSCYLTAPPQSSDPSATHPLDAELNLDHQILRQISALLARLPLLTATASPTPSSSNNGTAESAGSAGSAGSTGSSNSANSTYPTESLAQTSDVALTTLLGTMGTTLSLTQKMGRKAAVFEGGRRTAELGAIARGQKGDDGEEMGMGGGMGSMGGMSEGMGGQMMGMGMVDEGYGEEWEEVET